MTSSMMSMAVTNKPPSLLKTPSIGVKNGASSADSYDVGVANQTSQPAKPFKKFSRQSHSESSAGKALGLCPW
jgi:hypothetical protein